MLPEFDLLTPQTLPEALEMLADGASRSVPLAGGTNLIVDMRDWPIAPERAGECCQAGRTARHPAGERALVVGGGVTIAELLRDP